MATKDGTKRKTWTAEETIAFLEGYLQRKEEFQHTRKKRFAYQKVLEDLVARGVVDQSTTDKSLEIKMQTLLRTYRTGNYKNSFLQLVPYLELIFGDKLDSTDSNEMDTTDSSDIVEYKEGEPHYHTLNLSGKPLKGLEDGFVKTTSKMQEFISESPVDIKPEIHSRSASPISPVSLRTTGDQIMETAEELYYAERLRIYKKKLETRRRQKEEYYSRMLADSERRFRESEEAKERRHREQMDFYKRLLSKKTT